MRSSCAALAAALSITAALAVAAEKLNDYDVRDSMSDGTTTEWKEIEAPAPAFPKEGKLVQVQVGNRESHRYYIDPDSVALGKDGVMRYTAVVKTTGGATNVSFEGIRCDTRERKIYAVGRGDGTWAAARDPKWHWIERSMGPPVYYSLWRDYFCAERKMPTPPKRAVEAIKRGTPLPGGPTAYSVGD
jgi:hypothetical protein